MTNEAKDQVPEWAMTAAREVGIAGHLPTVHLRIARALLAAERRGIERAIPTLERLRHWIEDEVGAELPFTEAEQAEFDAIRRLGEAE